MILLEMHLDGQLLETVAPTSGFLQTGSYRHLKEMMESLKRKHAGKLTNSPCKPAFILSGISSCINSFVPLSCSDQTDYHISNDFNFMILLMYLNDRLIDQSALSILKMRDIHEREWYIQGAIRELLEKWSELTDTQPKDPKFFIKMKIV